MIPVRLGDTGPAVEDIQRRLLTLGYDLGSAGVDGCFAGATANAVAQFQRASGLEEDQLVGELTWSALVDATFRLGDRMLYLRLPHFHGHDVMVLQEALNILGFACGETDGIFGAFSERAVKEFQRNSGLQADGIVGPESVSALMALRHVWEGKSPKSHSAARTAPARRAEVLARVHFAVGGLDECGDRIAGRVVNLALATSEAAKVSLIGRAANPPDGAIVALRVVCEGTQVAHAGRPVVRSGIGDVLASRLATALAAVKSACPDVVIELEDNFAQGERDEQRMAVALLDAVCAVFG